MPPRSASRHPQFRRSTISHARCWHGHTATSPLIPSGGCERRRRDQICRSATGQPDRWVRVRSVGDARTALCRERDPSHAAVRMCTASIRPWRSGTPLPLATDMEAEVTMVRPSSRIDATIATVQASSEGSALAADRVALPTAEEREGGGGALSPQSGRPAGGRGAAAGAAASRLPGGWALVSPGPKGLVRRRDLLGHVMPGDGRCPTRRRADAALQAPGPP